MARNQFLWHLIGQECPWELLISPHEYLIEGFWIISILGWKKTKFYFAFQAKERSRGGSSVQLAIDSIASWSLISLSMVLNMSSATIYSSISKFYGENWISLPFLFCAVCFCFDFTLEKCCQILLWNQLKVAIFWKSNFLKLPNTPHSVYEFEKTGTALETRRSEDFKNVHGFRFHFEYIGYIAKQNSKFC